MKKHDSIPEFLIRNEGDTPGMTITKLVAGLNYFYDRDRYALSDKSLECGGEHHILVSDLAVPQCVLCLTHFTWQAAQRELRLQYGPYLADEADIRVRDLKALVTKVKRNKFPGKSFITQRIRCLTGHHFRYIERVFYDID